MIRHLLDSSVCLAIVVSGHEHHAVARAWFEAIQSPDRVYFCRQTQQSFLRLLSTASFQAQFADPPMTNEQAWSVYDALISDDRVLIQTEEPDGLAQIWRAFSDRKTSSPKVWMDAYLAAFAASGGFRFVTIDSGFRQYPGVDLVLLDHSGR